MKNIGYGQCYSLSLLITIIASSASSRNPYLDICTSTVFFFIFVQISSTCCLFLGILSPITSTLLICVPPIFYWKTQRKHLRFKRLLPFLPISITYVFFALPDPFLRDSLTYHLALSRQYAEVGSWVQTDEIIFGYFPQGWQAILALFQSVSSLEPSPISPRILSAFISIGTGLGITGSLLEKKVSAGWSFMAGIMFLLIPTALEFGTSCYVKLGWFYLVFIPYIHFYEKNQP